MRVFLSDLGYALLRNVVWFVCGVGARLLIACGLLMSVVMFVTLIHANAHEFAV